MRRPILKKRRRKKQRMKKRTLRNLNLKSKKTKKLRRSPLKKRRKRVSLKKKHQRRKPMAPPLQLPLKLPILRLFLPRVTRKKKKNQKTDSYSLTDFSNSLKLLRRTSTQCFLATSASLCLS